MKMMLRRNRELFHSEYKALGLPHGLTPEQITYLYELFLYAINSNRERPFYIEFKDYYLTSRAGLGIWNPVFTGNRCLIRMLRAFPEVGFTSLSRAELEHLSSNNSRIALQHTAAKLAKACVIFCATEDERQEVVQFVAELMDWVICNEQRSHEPEPNED